MRQNEREKMRKAEEMRWVMKQEDAPTEFIEEAEG